MEAALIASGLIDPMQNKMTGLQKLDNARRYLRLLEAWERFVRALIMLRG
jgi:hypothetical protein